MADQLTFPDMREALHWLLSRGESPAAPCFYLLADEHGTLAGPFPLVQIVHLGGDVGYIDAQERYQLNVFAPGEEALAAARAIGDYLRGEQIDTAAGFLDTIAVTSTPVEAQMPHSDTLNQAHLAVTVTARPL